MGADPARTITDLAPHLKSMEVFHRRYMVSGQVLKLWAHMVRDLPIRLIVPQHGAPLAGAAVPAFIDWAAQLSFGIDLLSQADYAMPA